MSEADINLSGIPDTIPATEYILENVEKYLDRVCFADEGSGRQLTFADFRWQVRKLAAHFWDRGWRTGESVVFFATSMIEYPVAYHAAASIGVATHPVNPGYLRDDLLRHLVSVNAKMIFASSGTIDFVTDASEKYRQKGKLIKDIISLDKVSGIANVPELLETDYEPPFPEVSFDPKNQALCIVPTSGTTGAMKFAQISHHAITVFIEAFTDMHDRKLKTHEKVLMSVPTFAGQSVVVAQMTLRNGWMTVMPSKFDLEGFLQAIEKHKVTIMYTTPGVVNAMGKSPMLDKYDLSTLRDMISIGSKLSATTINVLRKRLPNLIFNQIYGSIEGGVLTSPAPDQNNMESVGKISRLCKLKVVDIETRKTLGNNEVGEILTQGPCIFMGYVDNPKAKADSLEDGWFKMGDVGYVDENGYLYIIDRIKDVIKVSTFQVSPSELESEILTHPSVLDAAVIGIPAPDESGEYPKAFVIKKPGFDNVIEEDIVQHVKERVAPLKHLTGGVEFVTSIPRNPMGKILRRTLREQVLQKKTW